MRKIHEETVTLPEAVDVNLEINENDLLGECARQMKLEQRFGKLLAESEYYFTAAQSAVKTRRSELILKVQANPSLIQGSLNVQTCEAFYRAQNSYKKLVQAEAEAQFRHTQLENAMFSLSRRAKMLELLVNSRGRTGSQYGGAEEYLGVKKDIREIERAQTDHRLGKRLKKKGEDDV